METKDLQLPIFDGQDFGVWKAKVEAKLQTRDLDVFLLESIPPIKYENIKQADGTVIKQRDATREAERAKWQKNDKYVRAYLLGALSDKQAKIVLKLPTSKEIWERLSATHEQRSIACRVVLQKEFFDLQMNIDEKVEDYIGRAEYLHGKLMDIGVKFDESVLVGKIVSGLPRRFMNIMSSWGGVHESEQRMTNLIPRLLAEEQLINRFKKVNISESTAMLGENRKGKIPKKPVWVKTRPRNNQQQDKCRRKQFKCYGCQQPGHIRKNCPKEGKSEQSDKSELNQAESTAVVVADANCVLDSELWLLDSGASEHMSYDASNFSNYEKLNTPKLVRFGNHGTAAGIGRGNIEAFVVNNDGERRITLTNVLHVPEIRRKLISVSATTGLGNTGEIMPDRITIRDTKGAKIFDAEKNGNLYAVELREIHQVEANAANATTSLLELWHNRFGHINKQTILSMAKHNSVDGLGEIDVDRQKHVGEHIDCGSCQLGKLAKKPMRLSTRTRSQVPGESIHLDICGPVGATTISGGRYFALFKDEHSNFRFIHVLKTRDEVFDCMRSVFASIVAETGNQTRRLYSDCGSEFTSKRSKELFIERGIIHKTSVPFNPAQNGFIERDNRTVMEGVRSMLHHKNVDPRLWGEAALTFVYLLNRTTNKNTGYNTPYELFYGKKPSVAHLREFGCTAYVKTQNKKRSGYQPKLEARAIRCIFVGYDRDYTYRVYSPAEKKVILSRDVSFNEEESFESQKFGYSSLDDFITTFQKQVDEDTIDDGNEDEEEALSSELESSFSDAWLMMNDGSEPLTYEQAVSSPNKSEWIKAMDEEYSSLIKNQTWCLVNLPDDRRPITSKWVFKLKLNKYGLVDRYKARLVARGFSQRAGLDYTETFAPVVRIDSLRTILALIASLKLDFVSFDVKTAFLHGDLEEEIYMIQPRGYEQGRNLVCRLKKSLYGLKQASRAWNICLRDFLIRFDLKPLKKEACIYVRGGEDFLLVSIYVDDGIICGKKKESITTVLEALKTKFEITIGNGNNFVGLQIDRTASGLFVSQKNYIERIVSRFDLSKAKAISVPANCNLKITKLGLADREPEALANVPYREAIGSLLYVSNTSRPDICFIVNKLAAYSAAPRASHWSTIKQVIKYLNTTKTLGLLYEKDQQIKLQAYCDADFAADLDTRRSTSGYLVLMGSAAIIWRSVKQTTVASSTTNAEFIAASTASTDILWVRQLLTEAGFPQTDPTICNLDNQGAIRLICNEQINSKVKHLDVKYMFIREHFANKLINFAYVSTDNQLADIMTKSLPKTKFEGFRGSIGLVSLSTCMIATLLTSDAKLTEHIIDIDIDNPCQELRSAFDKSSLGPQGVVINHWRDSYNRYHIDQCDKRFNHEIMKVLDSLEKCVPHRNKRGIMEAVGVGLRLAAGVTNFLMSASEKPEVMNDGSMARLGMVVADLTRGMFTNPQVRTPMELTDALAVTKTGANNRKQIELLLGEVSPPILWASYHTLREMVNGLANLMRISQACSSGYLAINEIAELLNDDSILKIDYANAEVIKVEVDKNKHVIRLWFTIRNEKGETSFSFVKRDILMIVASATISSALIFAVIEGVKLLMQKRKTETMCLSALGSSRGEVLEEGGRSSPKVYD